MIKATIGALKLEQSVKEVAQPRPTRPPPWRVKCNRGSEFGVACTLVFGARGYKPRTGDEIQPSLMPTEYDTRSITQMMQMNWNVMVSLRNRKHVSRSMMIKAKNMIMMERIWINRVISKIMKQPLNTKH